MKFDKEYIFGFETLVFATSGILSMHNQPVTLQRERKNLKSHHMTLLKIKCVFKMIVHPKMKNMLFTQPRVFPKLYDFFFCGTNKKTFLKNVGDQTATYPIDFQERI